MFVNKIIIQEEKTKEQANTSDDRINDELGAIVKQVGDWFFFLCYYYLYESELTW